MTGEELRRIIPRDQNGAIIGQRMKQIDTMLVSYPYNGRELDMMDLEIRMYKKQLEENHVRKKAAASERSSRSFGKRG